MPKAIACLSEQLSQYLEAFRDCFSKHPWKNFVTVLLGLIECEERKTMTGKLRVVGEQSSLRMFSHPSIGGDSPCDGVCSAKPSAKGF